uniref:Uncharacterized protein n=1 Tax=Oryza glumipatula TaxID=40148 RepID=A0A0D9ZXT3_9ORYZ
MAVVLSSVSWFITMIASLIVLRLGRPLAAGEKLKGAQRDQLSKHLRGISGCSGSVLGAVQTQRGVAKRFAQTDTVAHSKTGTGSALEQILVVSCWFYHQWCHYSSIEMKKVQLIKMRLEVLSDCYSGYRFCAEVKLKL